MKTQLLLAAALLAAVLVEFTGHVRTAEFVYEDQRMVDAMPAASEPWMPARLIGPGRWLQMLAWRLAPTPAAGHALSLGLHLLVVALAWGLVYRLSGSLWLAWATAAIFALHPLQVQPVAYAAARGELLAAAGVLGACWLATCRAGWRWPLVGLCLLLGLAGKESAIAGLALVPLTLAALGRLSWLAFRIFAGYGVALLCGLLVRYGYGESPWRIVNIGEHGAQQIDAWGWLVLQATAVYRMLALSVWPGWLTPDPDLDVVPAVLRVFGLVAFLGVIEAAWRARRVRPMFAFGLAFLVIAILPRLIIQTPLSVITHHFYLSMFGVSLCLASLIVKEPERCL